jgi:hypothetical protein
VLRTNIDIQNIQKHHITPTSIECPFDTNIYLRYLNENKNRVIQKNTGPRVLNLWRETPLVIQELVKYLQGIFGNFYVTSTLIFDVNTPHVIHNDDDLEHDPFLAFCLPLKYVGDSDDIKLILFNQYYYQGGAKFFRYDNKERPVFSHKNLSIYDDVFFLSDAGINNEFKQEYLTHLQDSWLQGLTINTVLDWKVGDILCFNCNQLHCSSNFLSKGVDSKIALSIFTAKERR